MSFMPGAPISLMIAVVVAFTSSSNICLGVSLSMAAIAACLLSASYYYPPAFLATMNTRISFAVVPWRARSTISKPASAMSRSKAAAEKNDTNGA